MKNITIPIPEQYKLNDRCIKYSELIEIFKRQNNPSPDNNTRGNDAQSIHTHALDSILADLSEKAPTLTQEVYNSKTKLTPQKIFYDQMKDGKTRKIINQLTSFSKKNNKKLQKNY